MRKSSSRVLRVPGTPNAQQQKFFASRARYTAYGGARGGGKSWALRRKLVALCLRYPGIRCLLVRRSYAELRQNHVLPLLAEYPGLITCREAEKRLAFPNGSGISLGYCSSDRDVLRYQGQEYDIIAIDEATQLTEYQFSIFKACLRGVGDYPRRMYLTCNPGRAELWLRDPGEDAEGLVWVLNPEKREWYRFDGIYANIWAKPTRKPFESM